MSLGRVSYLESWEHQPPSFLRRSSFFFSDGGEASGDDESGSSQQSRTQSPDLSFRPSSLPTSITNRVARHRLSFNPIAGRGWTHSSAAAAAAAEPEEEQIPLFQADLSPDVTDRDVGTLRWNETETAVENVFQDPKWNFAETTPAFEVTSGKRIRRFCDLCWPTTLLLTFVF